MSITIRRADLEADRAVLIDSLMRYLTPRSDEQKFDWLYQRNPDGPARVWLAVESAGHNVVGSAAAIPRRMYVEGVEQLGCVLADFWIDPGYRSLGPAVQLQRACMEGAKSGEFALCFDYPQSNMGAVYKRLGIDCHENLLRMAKPLRVDRKIGEFVKPGPLCRSLSMLGNRWLALRDRGLAGKSECTISAHQGVFGEEFSLLAQQVRARYGVCVRRSAAYLNWRYRDHYYLRYETLTARVSGALKAYVVFVDGKEYGQIVDLFGVDEPSIISDLVGAVAVRLRARGALSINASLLSPRRWVGVLERLGFYVRESSPIVTYSSPSLSARGNAAGEQGWYLTYGDIDP